MIQSKHCDLCKHEKRSLKIGLTCRLTKKRPDFEQTCNNFNLSFTAKQNYKDVVAEFEKVKNKKKKNSFKVLFSYRCWTWNYFNRKSFFGTSK